MKTPGYIILKARLVPSRRSAEAEGRGHRGCRLSDFAHPTSDI
jgi:hypothetical protein